MTRLEAEETEVAPKSRQERDRGSESGRYFQSQKLKGISLRYEINLDILVWETVKSI